VEEGTSADRSGTAREALRGALGIVVAGVLLGVAHNALALRSKPPRGLSWIREPVVLPGLETEGAGEVSRSGPGDSPSGYGELSDPLGLRDAPSGLPEIPDLGRPIQVQLPAVKRFFDGGAAVFVDARPREEYEAGHIPGAVSLPYEEAGFDPERLERFDPGGKPVIVYCGGGACELSTNLALRLVEAGKKKILVFVGGWTAWQAEGYPVESGPGTGSGS